MASYVNYRREDAKKADHNKLNKPANFQNKGYQLKSFQDTKDVWRKYCEFWKQYPDYFIDFIKPRNCKIDLYFYQRKYLRILFRYKKVYITATRGTAKSFTQILAMYLKGIMYPGIHLFICAPGKQQAAGITKENLEKIWEFYPILKDEAQHISFQKDYTRLVLKNGSKIDVVQVRDSARGGRRQMRHPVAILG